MKVLQLLILAAVVIGVGFYIQGKNHARDPLVGDEKPADTTKIKTGDKPPIARLLTREDLKDGLQKTLDHAKLLESSSTSSTSSSLSESEGRIFKVFSFENEQAGNLFMNVYMLTKAGSAYSDEDYEKTVSSLAGQFSQLPEQDKKKLISSIADYSSPDQDQITNLHSNLYVLLKKSGTTDPMADQMALKDLGAIRSVNNLDQKLLGISAFSILRSSPNLKAEEISNLGVFVETLSEGDPELASTLKQSLTRNPASQ